MRLEEILSIDNNQIVTESGIKTAIGNAPHEVGDMVWVDGACVFGNQKHSQPVMATTPSIMQEVHDYIILCTGFNKIYIIDARTGKTIDSFTFSTDTQRDIAKFCCDTKGLNFTWICDSYNDTSLEIMTATKTGLTTDSVSIVSGYREYGGFYNKKGLFEWTLWQRDYLYYRAYTKSLDTHESGYDSNYIRYGSSYSAVKNETIYVNNVFVKTYNGTTLVDNDDETAFVANFLSSGLVRYETIAASSVLGTPTVTTETKQGGGSYSTSSEYALSDAPFIMNSQALTARDITLQRYYLTPCGGFPFDGSATITSIRDKHIIAAFSGTNDLTYQGTASYSGDVDAKYVYCTYAKQKNSVDDITFPYVYAYAKPSDLQQTSGPYNTTAGVAVTSATYYKGAKILNGNVEESADNISYDRTKDSVIIRQNQETSKELSTYKFNIPADSTTGSVSTAYTDVFAEGGVEIDALYSDMNTLQRISIGEWYCEASDEGLSSYDKIAAACLSADAKHLFVLTHEGNFKWIDIDTKEVSYVGTVLDVDDYFINCSMVVTSGLTAAFIKKLLQDALGA